MGHPGKAIKRPEKDFPLTAQGRECLLAHSREAIVTTVAPSLIGLPPPAHEASLLEFVQHGVKRCKREAQCASGSFLDALGDFETIKWLFCEKREDGHFGASPGDFRPNPLSHAEYRNPIF